MTPEQETERRLATDTDDGLLLIISGPSGVGKTTITRGVERSIADSVFSVSCTTRTKTAADVEGVDYRFVDDAEFDVMVAGDEFLECANVFGKKYGTPKAWVDEQLKRGRLVILEIDVEGAKQVKGRMPESFAIFVMPPDEQSLLARLRSRSRESDGLIRRRFAEAKREMEEAHRCGAYDTFIVNSDLDVAINDALRFVHERRGMDD